MSRNNPYRNSKRGRDGHNIKAMGRRTYGYDFANDGYRPVIQYRQLDKFLKSKIGKNWNKIWSELNKKYDHRTYIGKETLDYIEWMVFNSRWTDYYIDKNDCLQYKKTYRR